MRKNIFLVLFSIFIVFLGISIIYKSKLPKTKNSPEAIADLMHGGTINFSEMDISKFHKIDRTAVYNPMNKKEASEEVYMQIHQLIKLFRENTTIEISDLEKITGRKLLKNQQLSSKISNSIYLDSEITDVPEDWKKSEISTNTDNKLVIDYIILSDKPGAKSSNFVEMKIDNKNQCFFLNKALEEENLTEQEGDDSRFKIDGYDMNPGIVLNKTYDYQIKLIMGVDVDKAQYIGLKRICTELSILKTVLNKYRKYNFTKKVIKENFNEKYKTKNLIIFSVFNSYNWL